MRGMSRDLADRSGHLAGLVLAAGAGSRFGGPKALASDEHGPWLPRAVSTLLAACDHVTVVLGAEAEQAERMLAHAFTADAPVATVVAESWAEGLSESLATGIRSLGDAPHAVLVTLVDLPELRAEAVLRVARDAHPAALRRAVYGGRPGHPVLLGAEHWPTLLEELHGDRGAGPYLKAHGAEDVDCTDLGGGGDVDERPAAG